MVMDRVNVSNVFSCNRVNQLRPLPRVVPVPQSTLYYNDEWLLYNPSHSIIKFWLSDVKGATPIVLRLELNVIYVRQNA